MPTPTDLRDDVGEGRAISTSTPMKRATVAAVTGAEEVRHGVLAELAQVGASRMATST